MHASGIFLLLLKQGQLAQPPLPRQQALQGQELMQEEGRARLYLVLYLVLSSVYFCSIKNWDLERLLVS